MKTHLFAALVLISIFSSQALQLPNFFPNSTAAGPWACFLPLLGCHSGQKVEGLGKLKKYFQHFGYINSSFADNITDEFDEILHSAIKTYQLNFNLDSTGKLDIPTLKHLITPRCGIADIINDTSTMNSGKKSLNIHSVSHYSLFPGSPRWPINRRNLTYAFHPNKQIPETTKMVFARAFQRWATIIPMTFNEQQPSTTSFLTADIRITFASGEHGDGEPFDGVLGTLAHAFSPPSGLFHIDADEDWVVDGDFSSSSSLSAVDLESVAIHEIGHLLGLGHSSVEDSIMYPSISSGTRKVMLAGDDIEGIQYLYGSNPSYNGSIQTTTGQRETSNGGVHDSLTQVQFLLVVVMALLIIFT
ncbi:metalloendoproteinase 2-MMP-like [Impatiens glandulifera]|uniref:metalloendoproteinase 2-MMP-like n=1 Tax=Impatiens glandulifera TaxID=253017 RepID=UPI001FB12229|nr:metalloendoproteinase 2-MMP-like [Impatiens glandulifera]